jgi:hypothetical protein
MKKNIVFAVILATSVTGTFLFAQNMGRLREDHRELQDHYNSCTRVINELRDARRAFAIGTSGTWGMHKKQVLDDLQRAEMSLFQYRADLERADEKIMRQDLHPEVVR